MFNNIALDVVIGLLFIFLLYSLLATIVQEIVATQLAFRAKVLEKAILRMLEDGKTTTRFPLLDRIKGFIEIIITTNRLKDKRFATAFYTHPLIKYLAEDNYHSKPAYLHASNFSKIIIDLLHGVDADINTADLSKIKDSIINRKLNLIVKPGMDDANPANQALIQQTKKAVIADPPVINHETQLFLLSVLYESGNDIKKFRMKLEKWYDDTMERASEWYKRYTQMILFIIGFTIAAIFNVDTIAIATKLSRDPKLREQLVQNAGALLEKKQQMGAQLQALRDNGQTNTSAFSDAKTGYDSVTSLINNAQKIINEDIAGTNSLMGLGWKGKKPGFAAFMGWIITALAISLGSPFWFDLLSKMMNLRGSGNKINIADDKPKNP